MQSVVVKKFGLHGNAWFLALRTHDLGGTDYERILRLTERQAQALVGPHTGISASGSLPEGSGPPLPLKIERVPVREPGTRAWRARIGDDLVTAEKDGRPVALRLSDSHVEVLHRETRALFDPGEPDWMRRDVEDLEDSAIEKRKRADEAFEAAVAARRRWQEKLRREAREGIPDGEPPALPSP